MFDICKLRRGSEPIDGYLSSSSKDASSFAKSFSEYRLNTDVIEKLKKYAGEIVLFAFSAEWCPDCQKNIPVLGLISKVTGLEARVFGNLIRDPKKPKGFWKIPPSPAEVEEFQVRRIPTIVVIDKRGMKIGEIIENPPKGRTLEEALLDILETETKIEL